jgi:translation elongation factor EF-1beta
MISYATTTETNDKQSDKHITNSNQRKKCVNRCIPQGDIGFGIYSLIVTVDVFSRKQPWDRGYRTILHATTTETNNESSN